MGDLHAGWRLPTLVLTSIDQSQNVLDGTGIKPGRDQVRHALIFLDIAADNGIQNVIRRQRVLVGLVGPQFGGGRSHKDALRDHWLVALRVAPAGDLIYQGLRHVLNRGESPCHVPIQGRVADTHFTLVARCQHHPPEFVRESHKQHPPDSSL